MCNTEKGHDGTLVGLIFMDQNPGVEPPGGHRGLHLHMDTEFIFTVEHLHCLNSLGDGLAATDENAINVKSKDEGVGDCGRRKW